MSGRKDRFYKTGIRRFTTPASLGEEKNKSRKFSEIEKRITVLLSKIFPPEKKSPVDKIEQYKESLNLKGW